MPRTLRQAQQYRFAGREEISPGLPTAELPSPGIEIETPEGYGYFGDPAEGAKALRMARRKPKTTREIWEEEGKGLTGKAKERYERTMEERIRATQPPDEFAAPEFSAEGEKRFEQQIFRQLETTFDIPGGNPFLYDPDDEVRKIDVMLPGIFNKFFRGQITWADRNNMNKDEAEAWNGVVKGFHAYIYDQAANNRKKGIDAYNWMKSKWDNEKKTQEAELERLRKQDWEIEKMGLQEDVQIRKEKRKEARKGVEEIDTSKLLKVADAIIAKGMGMDVAYMEKYDVNKQRAYFDKRMLLMQIIQNKPDWMNEIGIRKAADFAGIISKIAINKTTGELIGWDEVKKKWLPIK